MEKQLFNIKENVQIAKDTFMLLLAGDTSAVSCPGQFVNIALDGLFLRRPISVCDWSADSLTLIYKVVGKGTAKLSHYQPGITLDLLVGLGNGYDIASAGDRPLLVGGGVGVPPLFGLAKRLLENGVKPTVVMGFNNAEEVFLTDEFHALGADVRIATADGSVGTKGFVTACLDGDWTSVYTCGPEPMLKAVYTNTTAPGQFSFEERMGCGFGACMGCTCRTKYGNKRICKDGPVLTREEIIW